MNYLLLGISAFLNGVKSVFAKKGNAHINESQNIYTYNFFMFLTAFVIALSVGIPTWNGLSLKTLIIGIIYGAALYFAQFFLIKAISEGNTSVSTLFYSCGFLGPTFFSIFVYDEKVSFFKILGIILILVSFVVTVEGKGKTSAKWFIYIFSALFCNAFCGITQKIFAMSEASSEQPGFMIVVFLVGTVEAFIFAPKKRTLPTKGFIKAAVLSGIALGAVNMLNVFIAKKLPGSIVFPTVNSGGIASSAVLAWAFLKEKLTIKRIIGLLIGIGSIFMIALL